MAHVKGKFRRQYQGIGYEAIVTVEVSDDIQYLCDNVMFAQNWHGYRDSKWVGDGDPYWQRGAALGVQYALRVADQIGRCVTVISVEGNYTVTNPTIVGAAAIDAVWQSIGYIPSPEEIERIRKIVFSSWQTSVCDGFPKELPDFERNVDPQRNENP